VCKLVSSDLNATSASGKNLSRRGSVPFFLGAGVQEKYYSPKCLE